MVKSLQIRLGRHIQELRTRAGLTQAQLAERSNVSVEFISRVERGLKAPSIHTAERLAHALGVELTELFRFDADALDDSARDRIVALLNLLSSAEPGVLEQVEAVVRALVIRPTRR